MSLKNVNHQKRSFTWSMEKPSAKDYFLTVFIFAVCTLIGLLFQKLNFTDTNIVTIYILGVLLTSIVTDGYLCSVAGSFLSVFLFCFFLTEPRMSFKTYAVGYPVTFFIMLISSVLTGALAAKLKTHAKLSTQLAFRTQILFDTDRLLQKAKGETEILDVTCTQLLRLLNRNITAYVVENGTLSEGKLFSGEKEDTEDFLIPEEQQIAKWVCENRQHAGASTHHFPQAKCLYLAIRSGDNVYGVIGIPLQKETLDTFEYSILLSVINECALAMENAKNALEKEKNAVMAKNEQLRADLLRAISHDLRTPLCSISGNADMLLGNSDRLDEATKHQIYSDIYDDSEWLIGVVENLLSITRLNDGRLKFKFTDQLLDEVIAESLRHISRKHDDYKIVTDCEELVLARMDVRLIMQVLVNLIDNAIKYTPPGSVICIRGTKTDGKAQITVEYEDGKPVRLDTVIVSCQHAEEKSQKDLEREIRQKVLRPALRLLPPDEDTRILINPSGKFVVGGLDADTGLTGRKLMVDCYGSIAPHGGGAFSGKDATKVDRSGAYMARYIAKNMVAAGLAEKCLVSLAYAIGVAEPVMVQVDTFGTGIVCADDCLAAAIPLVFGLTPKQIIDHFKLQRPIYSQTAVFGHFGRKEFPWERTDKVEALRSALL